MNPIQNSSFTIPILKFVEVFLFLQGDLRQFSIREPRAANTMAQLIQNLWSAQRLPSISPISMLKRVAEAHAQFRGTQQQDAQELMRCLLQLLHT